MQSRADGSDGRERRRGRWRSGQDSRRRILDAAQACFTEQGYDRATVRAIAARADVDPAMVHYFFSTKSGLFTAAMELPADPSHDLSAALADGSGADTGARIVRHFLTNWDDASSIEPLFALLRSAPTDQRSTRLLREYIHRELHTQLQRVAGAEQGAPASLSASLISAQLVGLAIMRYVIQVEPLASADPEAIVETIGPVLQRYFERPDAGH